MGGLSRKATFRELSSEKPDGLSSGGVTLKSEEGTAPPPFVTVYLTLTLTELTRALRTPESAPPTVPPSVPVKLKLVGTCGLRPGTMLTFTGVPGVALAASVVTRVELIISRAMSERSPIKPNPLNRQL